MPIRRNSIYNDPQLGAAFEGLASLFGPPSAQEAAAYATADANRARAQAELAKARADNEQSDRRGAYDRLASEPGTAREVLDRMGISAGLITPNNSYYAVDQHNVTSRANNSADNSRALAQTRMQQAGETQRSLLAPVASGGTRFIPPDMQQALGLPATQTGVVEMKPGETSYLPDGRVLQGTPKPLSMDELQAAIFAQQPEADQRAAVMSKTPVEQIFDPMTGEPKWAYRADAVGRRPAAKNVSETEWRAGEAQRLRDAGKITDEEIKAAIMGGAAGGDGFNRATTLRKEVTSSLPVKLYQQSLPIYQGMLDTAGRDSKASDLNMVYSYSKLLDPESVVREGEALMVRNTASLPDWLQGYIAQVNGGAALTPETRRHLMTEAHGRIRQYEDAARREVDRYGPIADRAGLNRADILPQFVPVAVWNPPGAGAPVRVNSPEEAERLPSGTRILLPDGREGQVP